MTIRLKPSRAGDARALEYLQGVGCSYSKAVVNAVNGYLDAQEEEKREDSFLGRFRMMLREELKKCGEYSFFSVGNYIPTAAAGGQCSAGVFGRFRWHGMRTRRRFLRKTEARPEKFKERCQRIC